MMPLTAIPWRLVGAAGAVVAVALMGWRVSAWHESHKALPVIQAALDAELACADGSECRARENRLQEAVGHETVRIVTGYEAELAALRGRKPRVVRVCDGGGVSLPGTPGSADGTGPTPGVVSGQTGRDIGPDLYGLAREADEVSARLRAIQEWNRALAQQ
jgi:hypothetical protein